MSVTVEQAQEWVRQYEDDGMTIEEIALEAGYSTQAVRRWLVTLGYIPRRAGQREGVPQLNNAVRVGPRDQHHLRPTARIARPCVARWMR